MRKTWCSVEFPMKEAVQALRLYEQQQDEGDSETSWSAGQSRGLKQIHN